MDEEMAALGGDDLVKEFDNSDPMKATLLLGRLVPKNVATSIGVVLVVLLLVSAGLYSTNLYFFSSPDSDDSMGGIWKLFSPFTDRNEKGSHGFRIH